ncbi:cobalt ECF transporter T component CbiQ [Methanoregula sp.]|uniref:cobalt ECF transporter T component CbiQ n=1 Tax=Methanoregula sp. TaxID=2052170 RepID=UPI003C77F82B
MTFMEENLDYYAQSNALRDVNCYLKLVLGMGAIFICVASPAPLAPLFILLTLSAITLVFAKIPVRVYVELLHIPVLFAFSSVIVILFLNGGGDTILTFTVANVPLTITTGSANLASLVLVRTFGGMCGLFFIALTTPMTEIFSVMHKLRVPPVVVDLSMLIYHFIFVFIAQTIAIHNAQTIRQGYTSFKRSLNSMAMLGAMLFIRGWKEAEDLIIAMDSRCYDGKLELPGQQNPPKPVAIMSVAVYLGLCITVAVMTSTIVPFR